MIAREVRTTRGLLIGRVRDRATGQAVRALQVVLGLRLGEVGELILARSQTDAEGIFRFLTYPGFRPGAHQWGILAGNGYRLSTPGSPYSHMETVTFAEQPVSRSVLLHPVTRLGGRVVQAGAPVPNAALTITNAASGAILAADLQSDAGGFFSLSDLESDLLGFGDYEISVPPTVTVSLQPSLQQPANTGSAVEVSLRPGDRKSVTISLS